MKWYKDQELMIVLFALLSIGLYTIFFTRMKWYHILELIGASFALFFIIGHILIPTLKRLITGEGVPPA